MQQTKNGILRESTMKSKKVFTTKASTAAGVTPILETPKYIFELVGEPTEDGVVEHIMTPNAEDMRRAKKRGLVYVATHETKITEDSQWIEGVSCT